jgi:hypothetical protein
VVKGTGYIFDPRYDIARNRAHVGMPAVAAGVYDLRVTNDSGSDTLVGAIEAKPHADEYKVVSNRSKWARPWAVGPRILSGGS